MEPSENQAGVVNWSVALENAADDAELLGELVEVFLDEGPQRHRDIHKAIAANDAPGLKIAAHTLKGAMRLFDVARMEELCQQLEMMGAQGKLDGASDLTAELDQLMERVVAEMRARLGE